MVGLGLKKTFIDFAGFGERGRDVARAPHVVGEEEKGQGELLVLARRVHAGDPELQG